MARCCVSQETVRGNEIRHGTGFLQVAGRHRLIVQPNDVDMQ